MRTHADMIDAARIEEIAARTDKSVHTVRSWKQRGSIPAECWAELCRMGIATLDELATAAERKAA